MKIIHCLLKKILEAKSFIFICILLFFFGNMEKIFNFFDQAGYEYPIKLFAGMMFALSLWLGSLSFDKLWSILKKPKDMDFSVDCLIYIAFIMFSIFNYWISLNYNTEMLLSFGLGVFIIEIIKKFVINSIK